MAQTFNPIIVLYKAADDPPLLMPVVVLSEEPDENGLVMLTEAVELPDGTQSITVPSDRCYQYDEWMMHQVNTLVSQAMDNIVVAQKMIEVRGQAAFETTEHKQNISNGKMH